MTSWPYPGMSEEESIQYDIDEIDMKLENYDCPCGCGNCATCSPNCGENGQKCPEGKCLGE